MANARQFASSSTNAVSLAETRFLNQDIGPLIRKNIACQYFINRFSRHTLEHLTQCIGIVGNLCNYLFQRYIANALKEIKGFASHGLKGITTTSQWLKNHAVNAGNNSHTSSYVLKMRMSNNVFNNIGTLKGCTRNIRRIIGINQKVIVNRKPLLCVSTNLCRIASANTFSNKIKHARKRRLFCKCSEFSCTLSGIGKVNTTLYGRKSLDTSRSNVERIKQDHRCCVNSTRYVLIGGRIRVKLKSTSKTTTHRILTLLKGQN